MATVNQADALLARYAAALDEATSAVAEATNRARGRAPWFEATIKARQLQLQRSQNRRDHQVRHELKAKKAHEHNELQMEAQRSPPLHPPVPHRAQSKLPPATTATPRSGISRPRSAHALSPYIVTTPVSGPRVSGGADDSTSSAAHEARLQALEIELLQARGLAATRLAALEELRARFDRERTDQASSFVHEQATHQAALRRANDDRSALRQEVVTLRAENKALRATLALADERGASKT